MAAIAAAEAHQDAPDDSRGINGLRRVFNGAGAGLIKTRETEHAQAIKQPELIEGPQPRPHVLP